LHFFQQLLTVPLYISYFLRVVDRHSLQGPYVFNFYSSLINGLKEQKGFEKIESIRKKLKKDRTEISGADLGAGSRVLPFSRSRKVAPIARYGISSQKDCLLLTQLVNMVRPGTCIELGTSLGLTTAYLSRAMPEGTIYTFEGNADMCKIATENWELLGCENINLISGDIDEHLSTLLHQVRSVDFAIIDANHTAAGLLRYFQWIKPYLSSGAMVYIDDIRWSQEMYVAWRQILKDKQVPLSIEFLNCGLLIFQEALPKQHYILSY
jgi:predicted O-methyltransferase YrrM